MPDKELCLTLQQRRAAERVSAMAMIRTSSDASISGTRVGPYEILEATAPEGEIESKRD